MITALAIAAETEMESAVAGCSGKRDPQPFASVEEKCTLVKAKEAQIDLRSVGWGGCPKGKIYC
jgi:hypothetical protein